MNHIYKVIWNTITQTWVAVSELSRAKGKTKSSKTLSAVVLAAVSAGAIVGDAEAAYTVGVGKGIAISLKGGALPADAKKEWSIAIGNNASAENGYDIAIGGHSHAKSKDTRDAQGKLLEGAAIAIGKETKATGQGTIAIGRKTLAEGEDGSAYGSQANAHGARSTALGYVASASGNDSLAGGALAESRGEGSVALGKDAQATGDYANAIGSSARATEWATAVGPGTQANGVASAAYGDGSVADGKKAIAMGSHATAKNESTIAIGNGAKVGATNGDVAATNGIAIGTESESKDQQAIAVGKQAIAAGNNSIALGNETTTTGGEGVAIGNTASASNQSVAFGSKAKATAQKGYSSAFGNESVADQADASAIGNTAKALAENATSVGAHSTVDTGATYGSALGRSANVSAANGTALGSSSSVTAADGTAVGTGATVSTAGGVALGQGSKSTRAALDGGSITISSAGNVISSNHITDKDITDKDNSTVNDVYAPVKLIKLINDKSILERVKNTIKGTAGAVSLGNNTTTRQLTNLAPGSADYDAVNVAQLKAVVGTIKHYNVTSKDGDITINPDTTDPNKTVWDLKINPKYKIKYFSVKSEGGTNENNDGATATDAIAIGKNASSTGSNAVSLGLGAKALGNNNTAIGPGAQAKDVRTTAIGYNAKAEAASAVGIGYEANATQSRSLAIGQDATATANNAIALGSSGQHSENKTTASAEHAVAIGSGAVANITNGIALGSQSKTTAASGQTGFDASQDVEGARVNTYKDLTNNKKNVRTSTLAGLSIGDTDKTRQINHLAAGTADDDAVNVAQLKSVNLAFKGDNNTKGDVRLHDQRLSVVGATGSFITTKANDNKLEISTTQGTFSTTADGKSSPTTAGLATTTAVASAINNSGWEVRAKGTKVGLVNPGDKVDFTNADNSIEIESSAEANGLSTIKFKAVTAKINTEKKHPVEITINNGITTKKIDKTKQATPTGKFVVPTGDDTNKYALATAYDVADKVNQTGWNLYTNGGAPALINPGDYVNFKSGNATNANVVTEASEGATISYDVNVDNTTIKIDPNGNKLTANTGDVDSVTNTEGNSKKGQVTIHKDSLEPSKTDSGKLATVDTVVKAVNNAKWFAKADNNGGEIADNAKTNDADDADGQAMGAGDKLTLKAGKNLRVKRDGANFTFATDNDVIFNKVTSGEVAINNGGKFTVGTGATINMGDNIVGGVKTGVADTDAVNVAQLKANTTTVEAGKNVTVNKTKDDATGKTFTVHSEKATVSKEDNSPIKLTSTSNTSEHTTDYKVGLDIDEGTLEVKNGKLAAKAQAKAIEVVESKEGDDNIAKVNVKSGQNKGDAGATYQVSVTKNDVKDAAKEAVDVRGSDFITVTPTDGEHLKTHTVAAKTGEITVAEATGAVTSIATATGLTTNKAVADAIAKSGFQLKQGEEATAKTVINPGDSLTFKDGQGTKAVVNASGDVTINANVASLTGGDNVTVKDNGNGSFTISATDTNTQASVSKLNDNSPITIDSSATNAAGAKDYKLDVNVDGTTISKAGGTLHAETGAIEEVATTTGDNAKKKGQVQAKSNDENKVATVSNVANAINKAKWFAKADNNGGEIADNAKTNDADDADGQAMGAGDKLTLKAGKNLRVKRDGANFTFATDNDVIFNKVTSGEVAINNGGKFTVGTGATINMGDNIVGGVKTGVADTDAVNVAQLKSTERHITPATYAYNDADKSVTLTYTDGNGNLVKNTNAKIDLSGLASKIKDYSFKTNATGPNLVGTGTDTTVALGKSVNFAASDNLTLKQDVNNGNVTYTYGLKNQVVVGEKGTPGADGKPGKDGVDGSIGVNGKDGSAVAINGKDGSIGLNGKDGKNGLTIKGQDGKVGVDGKDGETRLVYVEKADPTKPGSSDKTHELATLDDGMKYGGDIGEVANVKLNKQVDIKGGVTDKTKLSDNNIGVISTPNATTGGTELTVKLAKELKGLTSAEFKGGDDNAVTNITNSGITIKPANSNDDSKTVSLTNTGLNNGGNKITHVAEGKDDTDAVNVKQLKDFKTEVNGYGWNLSVNNGENSSKITKDTTVDLNNDDGNIKIAKNGSNVTLSLGPDVGLGKAGKDGKDGSLAVRGKDGASVEISGKDGSIGLTSPKGKDGTPGASATITVEKGTTTVNDDRDGGKQVNRIVYTDKDKDGNDIKREVATLDDGLKFKGDSKEVINRKLGSQVNITGGADSTKLTENNIGVVYDKVTNGLKVKLSKDVNLGDNGTITIGDTVVNKDGLTINGGPSVTKGGVNAGNQSVTNVKDGAEDNDAVNVKQLKTAKTEVEAGDHIDVTSRVGANGQTIYKVSAKGINDTSAAVKGGSNHVEVTKAANTHKDGSTTVTDYTVDLSKETKEDIKKGVDAHTEVTTKGLTFNADHGTTGVKKLGSKVAVNGDGKNITTTADENGVKVSMKDDIKVNSVTAKEVKVGDVNINENGINAGGKRITNVAPGKDGTDAVNVNQLKYVAGNISNQINNVDKGLRAGIAGALASGGLYHVTTAGKSMVSVGAGTYRGQNALAVGYSRLSDNGKVGVKFTVNSNSQGHSGASASVGYQW